jgi:hypothetical protein
MMKSHMVKSTVIAALLSCGAAVAYAQTPPAQPTSPPSTAPASPAPSPGASAPASRTAPADHTVSTGDFNASGDMAASKLIGTKVRNADKESIGKVDEIYLDPDAKVTTVVISVGGFLGVGSKDVGVKWSDLQFGKDGSSIVLTTALSKDQLKALPDYDKAERRVKAPPETASAPPAKPAPSQTR